MDRILDKDLKKAIEEKQANLAKPNEEEMKAREEEKKKRKEEIEKIKQSLE